MNAASSRSAIRVIPVCAALSAIVAVGCENSTTGPSDPLTMAETEALFLGISEVAQDTAPDFVSVSTAGGVIACPMGGQATVGIEPPNETAGPLRLVTTFNPDGCGLSSRGYDFTLDGNPNVRTDLTIAIDESTFAFSVTGSITGGVDWHLDDRSGACMIDLVLSAGLDGSGPDGVPTGTASGMMCDLEVEFDAIIVQTPG